MSTMRPRRGPGLGETGWLRLSLAGPLWDTGTPKRFQSGLRVGSQFPGPSGAPLGVLKAVSYTHLTLPTILLV
eukprot:6632949-Pyramimonas_sp.AAC.1